MRRDDCPLRRLVLFDIDGTLVNCGPQVRPFFRDAIDEAFGVTGDFDGYSFAGKTDPQIVTDLMRGAGVPDGEISERLPQVRVGYLARLSEGLQRSEMRLLPGVRDLLDELSSRDDLAIGLLTGNWEAGGRIKLSRFDLNGYFAFGAFGDGQLNRLGLPGIAIANAGSQSGRQFAPDETVLIGDSRLDVACALGNGIPLVAVATGVDSVEELREAGAETVVPDLTEPDRFAHLLA